MTTDFEFTREIFITLSFAAFAGISLGLNRWLHHKAAGLRTHAIVAIGAALVMLLISMVEGGDAQAKSHVLQGLITGVGFIGAGVILHKGASEAIKGLTTAASIWTCALIGASFGAGLAVLGFSALFFVMLILIIGRPLEELTARLLNVERASELDGEK